MKKYPLPSLSLLHTFEVVARRLSFTRAAQELCLTQSAVSRQIRTLEEDLGVALFRRRHRAIDLTPNGRRLYDAVTRGLDEVYAGIVALRGAHEAPQITVAASVAFSYYWLMPRLERFSEEFPQIDLRVLATDQQVDLTRDDADVAVLYGNGNWAGVRAQLLFAERVYPVCSPGYLRAHPELSGPADMPGQTLLHLDGGGALWGTVDWPAWLAREGVQAQAAPRGVRLNSYPMVLQSAEAGRGVALGWSYITDAMLTEGRLVCPIDRPLSTGQSYYICASEGVATRPAVAQVLNWIEREVKKGWNSHS